MHLPPRSHSSASSRSPSLSTIRVVFYIFGSHAAGRPNACSLLLNLGVTCCPCVRVTLRHGGWGEAACVSPSSLYLAGCRGNREFMATLTACLSHVRSSHACPRSVSARQRVSQCNASHLDVRPLVHALDAAGGMRTDPAIACDTSLVSDEAWRRCPGYYVPRIRVHVSDAVLPAPGPCEPLASKTPYSRFVSSM